MKTNYMRTAFRNLLKNKMFSIINLVGLTVAIATFMVIATIVKDDLSFDRFWKNSDQIYRLVSHYPNSESAKRQSVVFANLAGALEKNFPEVEAGGVVRRSEKYFQIFENQDPIKVDVIEADTNIYRIFQLDLLQGKAEITPYGHGNVIITEHLKRKYFESQNPIGEQWKSGSSFSERITPFIITAVIPDIPQNTYLRSDAIIVNQTQTMSLATNASGYFLEQLIRVKAGTNPDQLVQKINQWYVNFVVDVKPEHRANLPVYDLQPLQEIYLNPLDEYQISSNVTFIYALSGLGIALLLISCFNFVNLSMSQVIQRLPSFGIRKILGAQKAQIMSIMMVEVALFFIFSTFLAILLYLASRQAIENILGYGLTTNILHDLGFLGFLLAFMLLVACLTGLYPAWLMSRVEPLRVVKKQSSGSASLSGKGNWVLRTLVVAQFSCSIIVLAATFIISNQIRFMHQKDKGMDLENILTIRTFLYGDKKEVLSQKINQIPGVEGITFSEWTPFAGQGNMSREIVSPLDPSKKIMVNYINADENLSSFMKFRLQSGRLLTEKDLLPKNENEEEDLLNPPIRNALISQSLATQLQIDKLGEIIPKLDIIPVGIIEDFHSRSFHNEIKPTIILADLPIKFSSIMIKVDPANATTAGIKVHETMQELFPGRPIDMEWMDTTVEKIYEKENNQKLLAFWFSAVLLFIGLLGLTGLVIQSNLQRVKEIGIRKVLGASLAKILTLLTKEYVFLVLVSILVSIPVAWLLMQKWLETFVYRIDLNLLPFLGAGLIILVVTLVVLQIQALKTASQNPVDSLRDE